MSVQTHDAVEPLAPAWDALADRGGASPFLRPGWFGAWWRAFGDGVPEVLTVHRGDELAGVLPLYRRRGVLRAIANEHSPEFGLLADDERTAEDLAAELVRRTDPRASLLFVDPTRLGVDKFRSAATVGSRRLIVRTLARSPYVRIEGDWSSYERRLGPKLRSELRRRARLLEARGHTVVETGDGRAGVDERLQEGFAVEASGWKGDAGTAIGSRIETRAFYGDVAHWAAERGMLHLSFLRVDGRPIAFEYGLRCAGVHYRVKAAYDPEFRDAAPGKLLLRAVLEAAFADGCSCLDFLGDDEPYKLEWATGLRDLVLVQLFAPSPPGLLAWTALGYGRRLALAARRLVEPLTR